MNWKDDQIEKLVLFYSHNSLFLVPDSGTSFLHGTSFWSVCHGHYNQTEPTNATWLRSCTVLFISRMNEAAARSSCFLLTHLLTFAKSSDCLVRV